MASAGLKAIAILPKVGGSLSIVGCCLMLRDMAGKRRAGPLPLTTEVMGHITLANLNSSFWVSFLSTWMVPRGSPAFMPTGNVYTCNMQGFIGVVTFIVLEGSYAILAVLYWIVVARGWTERTTKRRRIRFFFLGLPAVVAVAFAAPLFFFQMYNFGGIYACTIDEYPLFCDLDPDVECERGTRKARELEGGLMIFAAACTVVIFVAMSLLVKNVLDSEKKGDKYLTRGQSKHREMTSKTLWQAIRYFAVFFVSNFSFYVVVGYDLTAKRAPLWIVYPHVILWPMFGVFNTCAYFYPKCASRKAKHPDESWVRTLLAVLDIDVGSRFGRTGDAAPPAVSDLIGDDPDLESPLFREENGVSGS